MSLIKLGLVELKAFLISNGIGVKFLATRIKFCFFHRAGKTPCTMQVFVANLRGLSGILSSPTPLLSSILSQTPEFLLGNHTLRRHPALRVAERSYNCVRQEPRTCPCGDFLLMYLILYRQCPRVSISLKTHLPVVTLVAHKVCSLFPREGDLNVEIIYFCVVMQTPMEHCGELCLSYPLCQLADLSYCCYFWTANLV